MSESPKPGYRPDIDGLRAVAVLPVVLFHAFPDSLKGGFVGVDIFFVISGFLISSILFRQIERGEFSLRGFYSRRIRRIFPALILLLTSCMAMGFLVLFPDELKQVGKHVVGGAAFLSNIMLWSEVGYFDRVAELKPLLHLWSLGVEEQFYIFWPLLLYFLWRRKISFLSTVAVAGGLSFALAIWAVYTNPTEAFYSPFARFWELMAGGLLAYSVAHGRTLVPGNRHLQSVVGLALVTAGFILIKKSVMFPGFWALLPVGGAFLLIGAGPGAWINKHVLSNRLMVWVGLISYPLYLWHWPLLAFLRIGISDGTYRDVSVGSRLAAVAVSILLSWITYQFFEKPIRFGRFRQQWVPALAALMVVIGSCGGLFYLKDGLPNRIDLMPQTASVLFEDYPHAMKNDNALAVYPEMKDEWSLLLSKDRPADILLLGDSHAHQYYDSLAALLPEHSVLNFSVPVCMPFSHRSRCPVEQERVLDFLKRNDSIHTVILSGYMSFLEAGFRDGNIEGKRVAADLTPENTAAFKASARKMLSSLRDLGKNVIVFEDIPDMIFKPRSCVSFQNTLMRLVRGGGDYRAADECGVPEEEFNARIAPYDEILASVLGEFPEVRVFATRELFLHEGRYSAFLNGHFMYWNSDHLTMQGTDMVIGSLVQSESWQALLTPDDPLGDTAMREATY